MTNPNPKLDALVKTMRPTLQAERPTEAERAKFVYDVLTEIYDYVKFDTSWAGTNTDERARLGAVVAAALPPAGGALRQ